MLEAVPYYPEKMKFRNAEQGEGDYSVELLGTYVGGSRFMKLTRYKGDFQIWKSCKAPGFARDAVLVKVEEDGIAKPIGRLDPSEPFGQELREMILYIEEMV